VEVNREFLLEKVPPKTMKRRMELSLFEQMK